MSNITKQWVDHYRPTTVKDMILPDRIKIKLLDSIKDGIPNYLFYGVQGSGKTATAIALCHDINCSYIKINASEEGGIDTLRTKVRQFASTAAIDGKPKIIIMDEMDGSSQQFQRGMRGFMNEFNNVRFIFTANYHNKIIPALHSRTKMFDFSVSTEERKTLMVEMAKRLVHMLKDNNIDYNVEDIKSVVRTYYPDNRRIIMETQGSISAGKFVWDGGNGITDNTVLRSLMIALHDKDFVKCREWSIDNIDMGIENIINALYEYMDEFVEPASKPPYIEIVADYDYKAGFSSNKVVWLLALCFQIMKSVKFNKTV